MPLNRREVLAYNVQIGSFSEMEILSAMVKEYGRPVHLTFNSLYYIPEQYPEIAEIIKRCMEIGFHSYIIADPALILYLRQNNIDCEIHLSGETAEVNRGMVDFFQKLKLKRVIFHRKNTIKDMQSIIAYQRITETEQSGHVQNVMPEQSRVEFEAFILNELCQFTGAFCNSLHCDEMGYLCRVPYRLGAMSTRKVQESTKFDKWKQEKNQETIDFTGGELPERYFTGHQRLSLRRDGLRTVCVISVAGSRDHTPQTGWQRKLYRLYGKRYSESSESSEYSGSI